MRRTWVLVLFGLLVATLAGCGEQRDGRVAIVLIGGCDPNLSDVQQAIDMYCVSIEEPAGALLDGPNCSTALTGVRLEIDEATRPVVVVVEGLERLDGERHRLLLRGRSAPVRLVSGEETEVPVPLAPLERFGLLAADRVGCPMLPHPVIDHSTSVFPSGHLLIVGSGAEDVDPDTAAMLIEGWTHAAERLPTPNSLYRSDHLAARCDDGRLFVAGGRLTAGGAATREVVALRGGEILDAVPEAGVDVAAALSFESLERPLVWSRPLPAGALFFGRQLLIADGARPAEMFMGDSEVSDELEVTGGQAFPQSGRTPTVVAYERDKAIVAGAANRIGRLTVANGNRQAIYQSAAAAVSARDGAPGLALPDGTVMVIGHRAGPVGLPDSPLLAIDPGGDGLPPAATAVPVPAGFPERGHDACVLPDGRVLVTGGVTGSGEPAATFLVLPADNPVGWEVIAGPELNVARRGHTADLLPDGRVFIIGGEAIRAGGEDPSRSVEIIAF